MFFLMESTMTEFATLMTGGLEQAAQQQKNLLGMPFDMARQQYSSAVRSGLIERSLIASARFERALSAIEVCSLGPWAR